jgi:hypothetical protein
MYQYSSAKNRLPELQAVSFSNADLPSPPRFC